MEYNLDSKGQYVVSIGLAKKDVYGDYTTSDSPMKFVLKGDKIVELDVTPLSPLQPPPKKECRERPRVLTYVPSDVERGMDITKPEFGVGEGDLKARLRVVIDYVVLARLKLFIKQLDEDIQDGFFKHEDQYRDCYLEINGVRTYLSLMGVNNSLCLFDFFSRNGDNPHSITCPIIFHFSAKRIKVKGLFGKEKDSYPKTIQLSIKLVFCGETVGTYYKEYDFNAFTISKNTIVIKDVMQEPPGWECKTNQQVHTSQPISKQQMKSSNKDDDEISLDQMIDSFNRNKY